MINPCRQNGTKLKRNNSIVVQTENYISVRQALKCINSRIVALVIEKESETNKYKMLLEEKKKAKSNEKFSLNRKAIEQQAVIKKYNNPVQLAIHELISDAIQEVKKRENTLRLLSVTKNRLNGRLRYARKKQIVNQQKVGDISASIERTEIRIAYYKDRVRDAKNELSILEQAVKSFKIKHRI